MESRCRKSLTEILAYLTRFRRSRYQFVVCGNCGRRFRIALTSSGEGPERKEKGVEEMGMTDMQFKSHLKGVVASLEEIKKELPENDEVDEAKKKLDEMIARFKSDIES